MKIASSDGQAIKAAYNWIRSIVAEAEPGMIYDGTVVKTMEFGAFVNFFGAKDASSTSRNSRAQRVANVDGRRQGGPEGQGEVPRSGRPGQDRLSMKVVDQETGEGLTEKLKAERNAEAGPRPRTPPGCVTPCLIPGFTGVLD